MMEDTKVKLTPVYVVAQAERDHVSSYREKLKTPEQAKELAKKVAADRGGTYEVWKLVARVKNGKIKPQPIPVGMAQCITCGSLVAERNLEFHANKCHNGEQKYRLAELQGNLSYTPVGI